MKISLRLMWLTCKIFIFTVALTTSAVVSDSKSETYDFIVVGAGVAGCVLANRLTENGKYTVLLLHSGGHPDPNSEIPAMGPHFLFTPEHVKWHATIPQKNVAGLNGGILMFPVGRALGGGSAVNSMHFNRGHPFDYDNWANLTGDQSWSYINMLPYFKRMEDYKGKYPMTDQHGTGGPITVTRPNYAPGVEVWLSAGHALEYPEADPNGPQKESFTAMEFNKKFGRRVSSFAGYVRPILGQRKNLKLIIHADVRKVLFERDQDNIRASGVTYILTEGENKGSVVTVQARKEVIVSGGGIGSPTILLRSGVGPVQVLKDAGVPLIKDLPVGKNLHDHPALQMDFIVGNSATSVFEPVRDLSEDSLKLYNETGEGPYSTQYGDCSQAFIASAHLTPMIWPDLHVVMLWSRGQEGVSLSKIDKTDLRPGETPIIVFTIFTRPESRGTVTLNATNVEGDPVLDFQYLEDPRDMLALIRGIKKTLVIFERAEPYKKLGARYNPRPVPSCSHLTFRSDDYWKCFIQQTGYSALHVAGSCKMGAATSLDSVVDTELKVIGISGLRVVDASVMPAVTNGNTQVPVYAIAEKASEMILKKWNV